MLAECGQHRQNERQHCLETGDPEWIGVLEHPDPPHGPNNHFIARYAFIAMPVGNSLDLNYIHNQVRNHKLRERVMATSAIKVSARGKSIWRRFSPT